MIEGRHKSFKVLNFKIGKVTTKIRFQENQSTRDIYVGRLKERHQKKKTPKNTLTLNKTPPNLQNQSKTLSLLLCTC